MQALAQGLGTYVGISRSRSEVTAQQTPLTCQPTFLVTVFYPSFVSESWLLLLPRKPELVEEETTEKKKISEGGGMESGSVQVGQSRAGVKVVLAI